MQRAIKLTPNEEPVEIKKIFFYHYLYFAGSLFQHVSTAGGDAENNAENQGKLTIMWNMA